MKKPQHLGGVSGIVFIMDYPEQTKIHGMIELLYQELNKANEQGRADLLLEYKSGRHGVGVSIAHKNAPEDDVAHLLGVSGAQAVKLLRYVCSEGFVRVRSDSELDRSHGLVLVQSISRAGLLEIGQVPDPKALLLSGLEAALRDVQQDPTLNPEEKEKKLDAGREAIAFIRSLAVEVATKVIVGG